MMKRRARDTGVPFTQDKTLVSRNPSGYAAVALDQQCGMAFLGRYHLSHPTFFNRTRTTRPGMQGADRLSIGKETGTWSHLLFPSKSVLSQYRVIIVDTINLQTINRIHLARIEAAGCEVRVRQLPFRRDQLLPRLRDRNFSGTHALTPVESKWLENLKGNMKHLRSAFRGYDYKVYSGSKIRQEVQSLLAVKKVDPKGSRPSIKKSTRKPRCVKA